MNLMRVAHANGIDLEGACEGVCACSTCHVILDEDVYSSLPEASEDEEDMLDQAFGLTLTSRLGCQVILTPDLDGIKVQLPSATRNFYVDGHVSSRGASYSVGLRPTHCFTPLRFRRYPNRTNDFPNGVQLRALLGYIVPQSTFRFLRSIQRSEMPVP
jgi:ferredoxin